MSIVGVPFELKLTPQESLAYGTYYSIDLHRTDIKPELITDNEEKLIEESKTQEIKKLPEESKSTTKKTGKKEKVEKTEETSKVEEKETEIKQTQKQEEDFSKYLVIKAFMPTIISNKKFDKIIFQDFNSQDVEYVLHPKADQQILQCGVGSMIELVSSKMENERNILCRYEIKRNITPDGKVIEENLEELKEAV